MECHFIRQERQQQPVACWAMKTGWPRLGVCFPSFAILAGERRFMMKSLAWRSIVSIPFAAMYCLSDAERWKRILNGERLRLLQNEFQLSSVMATVYAFSRFGNIILGMAVLVIHLDKEEAERRECTLCGLELALSLYHEYEELSPIVISSPTPEAVLVPGCACFSMVFRSPITERIAVASSAFAPGYSLRRLGYDAVVIVGRARRLQLISINADGAERIAAEQYRGSTSEEFERLARRNVADAFLSIGRAGENGVLFASVQSGGREAAAQGLGCLFGWKNLKGIMLPGFTRKDEMHQSGSLGRRVRRRQEKSAIARRFRKEGDALFIDAGLSLGWLPVSYYSERFDPRAEFLDGLAIADGYGVYPEACQDCGFACGRRTRDNRILPSWEEAAMLGSNLGFFSIESVRRIADAVREEGLGAADTGALLAYLATLPGTDYTLPVLKGRGVEEHVRVIHLIGVARGVGERLSEGLKGFPDAIQMGNHLPILTDLRGDRAGAVLAVLGLPVKLPAAWLLPRKPLSYASGAIMALYETAYRYALVSEGYVPMGTLAQWWGRLPRFIFRVPFLLRIAALLFRAYGQKGTDLYRKGLRIIDELAGRYPLPEHFQMEPLSSYGDGATTSAERAYGAYAHEKRIAEIVLKSRREKRKTPSSDSNAAVGPSEDRGLEGDPGLQNTTPSF